MSEVDRYEWTRNGMRVYASKIGLYVQSGDFDAERLRAETAVAEVAALREELAKLKEGFFQKVTDADLKKISDFVGDGDLPTQSFFMRADAGNLANMTMHMVREVQSLRIGMTAAEQLNAELVELLKRVDMTPLDSWYSSGLNVEVFKEIQPTESGASE